MRATPPAPDTGAGGGWWVVGALVLSHWLLDAPMHRPDLPLWPGSSVLVGGGLWNSIPATIAVEFVLFALGLWLFVPRGYWVDRHRESAAPAADQAAVLLRASSHSAHPASGG